MSIYELQIIGKYMVADNSNPVHVSKSLDYRLILNLRTIYGIFKPVTKVIYMKKDWKTTTKILEGLKKAPNDSGAWNIVTHHFGDMIVNFYRKQGLSAADTDDIAQETMLAFMKAYRAGKYDKEIARLRDWFWGIARKVMRNYKRRLPREQTIADDTTGTSFLNRIPDEKALKHTWDTGWSGIDFMSYIELARQKSPPREFKAFKLYALLGIPAIDVAKQLNITVNSVYIAKCRVLSKMRELMESEFEETD
ncbi:MAG: sigma-70 family RNA polymerase sigma factor [Planctomycetes bacterium]|nr:sigma-70 family RNA polymerase sigma factor [Planctomycetota bacterium]